MTYRILFVALLATAMGQSVVLTILPSLGRETGLSELQVSVILSCSALTFAVGSSLWSRVARRFGYRFTLMIGLTGYSAGTLLFAGVFSIGLAGGLAGMGLFVALLGTRISQSCVMSATPPSALGYALTHAGQQQHRLVAVVSKVTSANNLGQVLGPAMAGVLVVLGLVVPLFVVILLTLLALLLVHRNLAEIRESGPAPADRQQNEPRRLSGLLRLLVCMAAGLFFAMAMLQQTLGFLLMDQFGLSTVAAAQASGTGMMVSAIAAFAIQWGLIQRSGWQFHRLIMLGMGLLSVGYLIIVLGASVFQLYVGMALLGAGMGTAYPSVTTLASVQCTPGQRTAITGLMAAAPAMGYTLGPPLAALLYAQSVTFPLGASFATALCLLVLASSTIPVMLRKSRISR